MSVTFFILQFRFRVWPGQEGSGLGRVARVGEGLLCGAALHCPSLSNHIDCYDGIVHSGSHNPSQCGENFFHNEL